MNTYTTAVLIGVIESLIRPPAGLLDRYFPTVVTFESEEVHVDIIPGSRELAPLVSPLVEGQVMTSQAVRTAIIKPAYVKPKIPFQPSRYQKRAAGEQIGGARSNRERMDLHVAQELEGLLEMIVRRKEWMASQALRLGTVTLAGEKYPTALVDFQRTNTHTVTVGAGDDWTTSDDPFAVFDIFNDLSLKNAGVALTDAIMGLDAWKLFRNKDAVRKRFEQINASGTSMELQLPQREGLTYMGTADKVNIFTYTGWYTDPDTGTLTEYFPSKALLMTSPAVEGQQLHGAIQDPKAGLAAMEFFPKMWDEEDPAVRWLMVQSAPLVAPQRPDATVYTADVVGS